MRNRAIFTGIAVLLLTACEGQEEAKETGALFPIIQNDRWGYIDKTGKIVINPQFDWAWDFSEGLAGVKIGDRWGYIDKTGKYVWNPTK